PVLVHAKVPLLNHHTSGVRKEWYRHDLEEQALRDPVPVLWETLTDAGFSEPELQEMITLAQATVESDYAEALLQPDPTPEDLMTHIFAPTPVTEEKGVRE